MTTLFNYSIIYNNMFNSVLYCDETLDWLEDPNKAKRRKIDPVSSKMQTIADNSFVNNNILPERQFQDDQVIYVKIKKLDNFFNNVLTNLNKIKDRRSQIQKLCDYCTFIPANCSSKGHWHLWLELSEGHDCLSMKIEQGKYQSTVFPEGKLIKQLKDTYYHFKLFDEDDCKKHILHLRIDKTGKEGEIVYLKRSKRYPKITGTYVKTLANRLLDFIKPEKVVLNDDAKVKVPRSNRKRKRIETIHLRTFLPIVSPDGESWYGRNGFSPMCCRGKKSLKNMTVYQDPNYYYAAVKKVKNTKIGELYENIFEDDPSRKRNLTRCLRTVTFKSKNSFNYTISDLGNKMYTATKAASTIDVNKAKRDFADFVTNILTPYYTLQKHTKKQREYNLALAFIRHHFIWEKNFLEDKKNTSYQQFVRSTHLSFDSLMEKYNSMLKTNLGRTLYE